ncbi:LytTR family DNA-binding domain-containing protein [Spirosoma aerolatum]|uniref:LytTR family DNA-binding domain-containing protein n=1 Tax=Spirosoma aerolatum TaxID=1211326 RepID=UPI001FE26E17|nr:LytTR family DNA-binding domain-containing protein [Spirosoma aerolatum]
MNYVSYLSSVYHSSSLIQLPKPYVIFLEAGPIYSWQAYWEGYIIYTYSWKIYFQYLVPLLLIGYIAINISLLKDYLYQQKQIAKLKATEAFQRGQASWPLATFKSYSTASSPYLTSLKGRNAQGELDFPVKDVYFFTIEERLYYAELAKGRYLISKTLNELEAELDPGQFFRIKRDYIVNRQAIQSYAHWENGKYIVGLNTPTSQDIVIPRMRMQELREWLQKENKELLEVR